MQEVLNENTMRFLNRAMLEIIERAQLETRVISKAIVCELLKVKSLSMDDLRNAVCEAIGVELSESIFRNHIINTNEHLLMINNLDIKREVLFARIYEITVEYANRPYTRIALVHNVR